MNSLCKRRGHLWKVTTFGPKTTSERCSRCGEKRDRPSTPKEKAKYREWAKDLLKPMPLHILGRRFEKALEGKSGFEAMKVAERWEKKYPDRIQIVGVDDDYFASSYLVFLSREEQGKKWMGVSVYFIPQCTGGPVTRLFLYPGHVEALLSALRSIHKRSLSYLEVRRQRRWVAEARRARKKPRIR